jgi:putative Ca2+/H+ antiporter (TMEM165/GDT1 family)
VLYALIVAAVVIFIAEQGDKTQILAFALATRFRGRTWQVFLGILIANSVMLLVFAGLGRLIGSFLPEFWLWIISGVAFVAFGVFALLSKEEGEVEVEGGKYGPILTTMGLFVLAEIGDSAELITMTIAANPAGPLGSLGAFGDDLARSLAGVGLEPGSAASLSTFLGVWLGAVLGLTLADALAVIAGRMLGRRLPERLLRRVSGGIFVVAGVGILAMALLGRMSG